MAGVHRFMRWLLNGFTALVLLGLYEFETNDVGITEGRYLPVLGSERKCILTVWGYSYQAYLEGLKGRGLGSSCSVD